MQNVCQRVSQREHVFLRFCNQIAPMFSPERTGSAKLWFLSSLGLFRLGLTGGCVPHWSPHASWCWGTPNGLLFTGFRPWGIASGLWNGLEINPTWYGHTYPSDPNTIPSWEQGARFNFLFFGGLYTHLFQAVCFLEELCQWFLSPRSS